LAYEASLILTGPEYHERLIQQGLLKMRRMDLLRKQAMENETRKQLYRSLGRSKMLNDDSSIDNFASTLSG
jgi:hypothetical protein